MFVRVTCKNEDDLIKMKTLERPQDFPIITPWVLFVAMEVEGMQRSGTEQSEPKSSPQNQNG